MPDERKLVRKANRRSSTVSGEQLSIIFLPTEETILHDGAAQEHQSTFPAYMPPRFADIKAALKRVFEYDIGYLCYMIEPEYMLDKKTRLDAEKLKNKIDTIHSGWFRLLVHLT